MKQQTLLSFAQELQQGNIQIVDLTQTLSPSFPALQLPEQFGQVWSFSMEQISRYDENGPAWYWNNFSCENTPGPTLMRLFIGSVEKTKSTIRSILFH